ncbi:MAG: ABC transporter permease subunit, partial [Oscillospiraceae bacterium]
WPGLLTGLRIWQGAGFGSIVYLAAITGIDQEMYEAAKMDGATRWQCIIKITLPLLKNTIVMLTIMSVGKIFYGDFGMIYAMVGNNTLLYPTTDVIDTYVYRSLMELGDMGMSSAVGFIQSILGFIFVVGSNFLAKKVSPESALF